MKVICYPAKEEWDELVKRPHLYVSELNATVEGVLNDVKNHGDSAVIRYEEKFDHAHLDSLSVSDAEMEEAESLVSLELKHALELPIITFLHSIRASSFMEKRWKQSLV